MRSFSTSAFTQEMKKALRCRILSSPSNPPFLLKNEEPEMHNSSWGQTGPGGATACTCCSFYKNSIKLKYMCYFHESTKSPASKKMGRTQKLTSDVSVALRFILGFLYQTRGRGLAALVPWGLWATASASAGTCYTRQRPGLQPR